MSIRTNQAIVVGFAVSNPSTGAYSNADSTPTGTLFLNGTSNAATVTITNVSTGHYKASVTLPTLAIGDIAELLIAATANSVAGKEVIWRDCCDLDLTDTGGVKVASIADDAITANAVAAGAITASEAPALADIASIKAKTDNLPADPADASDIASAFSTVTAALTTIAGYIDTEIGAILSAVDTEVASIKAKTDNLPSDTAASLTAIASSLTTLSGYVDTEVAAILAAVDTEVAAIKAKTDALPASPAGTGDIPGAATVAAAVIAATVEGTLDLGEVLRVVLAACAGKADGLAGTTAHYRDQADTKNRITATVDEHGNRTAITLDPT